MERRNRGVHMGDQAPGDSLIDVTLDGAEHISGRRTGHLEIGEKAQLLSMLRSRAGDESFR
jgi:hypothetical protein